MNSALAGQRAGSRSKSPPVSLVNDFGPVLARRLALACLITLAVFAGAWLGAKQDLPAGLTSKPAGMAGRRMAGMTAWMGLHGPGRDRRTSLDGARTDLLAVLAGAWSSVDVGPLDALSTALTRYLNVTELEGHSAQVVTERKVYYALASMPAVRTICEIGFNGGHSAALWLHANPTAHVYMFDLFTHEYSPRGEAFLRGPKAALHGIHNASDRLHIVKGSSTVTVPTFAVERPGFQCDLLSVDGAHTYHLAVEDLTNMQQLASPAFNILLVDDTNCGEDYCVDDAVHELERRGAVHRLLGFSERINEKGVFTRGITVAQYLNAPAMVSRRSS